MDELYYARGSPWSMKAVWTVLMLSKEVVSSIELKHTLSSNSLLPKLSDFLKKHSLEDEVKNYKGETMVTLPIFFHEPGEADEMTVKKSEKACVLRHAYDIVEFMMERQKKFGSAGISEKQFCEVFVKNKDKMKYWKDKIHEGLRFTRGQFCAKDHGDNMLQYLLPEYVGYIPGVLSFLKYIMGAGTKQKYFATDIAIKREDVERTLKEANEIVSQHDYLVDNQFSFADIAMCS